MCGYLNATIGLIFFVDALFLFLKPLQSATLKDMMLTILFFDFYFQCPYRWPLLTFRFLIVLRMFKNFLEINEN